MGRVWCAYCKRRGHSLFEDRVRYIEIVCVKSRISGRCYRSHTFLNALFNARSYLPADNGAFILLCRNLWEVNKRLEPNKDYRIYPSFEERDERERGTAIFQTKSPLFRYLRSNLLKTKAFGKFVQLLEYFGTTESKPRNGTTTHDIGVFLDEILHEPCCRRLHVYLQERGFVGAEECDLKAKLRNVWFSERLHKGKMSCAFERVFIGGLKIDKDGQRLKPEGFVTGIHNWVRYYLLEKHGFIQYHGLHGKQPPNDGKEILNIEFALDDVIIKPVGSTFIGTTPAFDICLYTAVFLTGCKEGHTYIRLGSHNVDLYCPGNVPNGDVDIDICYSVEH
ncbi:poly(U)-specific endoribonuclease-like [Glandiceps talaboti]